MQKPNVLLLETISPEADSLLRAYCNVFFAKQPDMGEEISSMYPIDAIVTRGKGRVDQSLIDSCRGLKVISRCGVGLDNIDVKYATSKGIKIVNAPGTNAATVAEHTLSLMLSLQRKMRTSVSQVAQGNWSYRTTYDGDDLRGKTLGIIGLGGIGQRVAMLANAFGMKVLFWNRSPIESGYSQVDLDALCRQSHIISIHVALNTETKGLIDVEKIALMDQNPILINTARGGVVSDADVIDALKSGAISGFGADVLEQEPPDPMSELLQLDNVEITPHSASLTRTTYNDMCVITVKNTIDVLRGKEIEKKWIYNRTEL